MKKFLNVLLAVMMFAGVLVFSTSCKSEGEKLASKGIAALNAEDLDTLIKLKDELSKLSAEEQQKAKAYLEKYEPQYEEKGKKLVEKKFGIKL